MLKKARQGGKGRSQKPFQKGVFISIDPIPRNGPYLEGRGCGIVCEFFDPLLNHAWPVLFSFFDTILPLSMEAPRSQNFRVPSDGSNRAINVIITTMMVD